jgi:hypothetical protein
VDGRRSCAKCKSKVSVTAKTIFERSRLPHSSWLVAAWHMTDSHNGISPPLLQQMLKLRSHQSACSIINKLRTAMGRAGRDPIRGPVELGVKCVDGIERTGCEYKRTQFVVAIAIEVLPKKGFGRVRIRRIGDDSADSLAAFVSNVVRPGAEVHTDIAERGYKPVRVSRSTKHDAQDGLMTGIRAVANKLKYWLGFVRRGWAPNTAAQLDLSLNEFVFHFNSRRSRRPGLLFYRLLKYALKTPPTRFRAPRGRNLKNL